MGAKDASVRRGVSPAGRLRTPPGLSSSCIYLSLSHYFHPTAIQRNFNKYFLYTNLMRQKWLKNWWSSNNHEILPSGQQETRRYHGGHRRPQCESVSRWLWATPTVTDKSESLRMWLQMRLEPDGGSEIHQRTGAPAWQGRESVIRCEPRRHPASCRDWPGHWGSKCC